MKDSVNQTQKTTATRLKDRGGQSQKFPKETAEQQVRKKEANNITPTYQLKGLYPRGMRSDREKAISNQKTKPRT